MPTRRDFLAGSVAAGTLYASPATGTQKVALRTHEWFGDKLEEFEFPAEWKVKVHHMRGHQTPVLSAADIKKAIQNPVGTPALREIAAGKKTVAIVFDDLTRPTPTYEIVPHVLAELKAAKIQDENILFIVGHALHYQMNGMEVAKKLGLETVQRYAWWNHNAWLNLKDLGTTTHKNQILVNAYYHAADVRITLSGLKAHGIVGYGGGPKLILPGVSGYKTIEYNHRQLKQSRRTRYEKDGTAIFNYLHNEQRQDMIEAAQKVGVHFSVQCAFNQDRKPTKVVAGELLQAHRAGAEFAITQLSTDYAKAADVLVVNAYPKGSQLHEHFSWGGRGLKDGGSIVVINQNPMGEYVWHYLDETGFFKTGNYWEQRAMRRKRYPQAGQVLLYSQYLQKRELDNPYFPPEAIPCHSWSEVLAKLKKAHGGSTEVAVYPYAGMQHGPAKLDSMVTG